MLETYKIEFDEKVLKKQLKNTGLEMPKIAQKMLRGVSAKIRLEVLRNLRGRVLQKRKGRLYKSVRYYANKDYTAKIMSPTYYGWFQEHGVTIRPRKKEYLTFKIDGEWKKVKAVTLPARPFMRPAVDVYFSGDGEKAKEVMNTVLQKELNKVFNKDSK